MQDGIPAPELRDASAQLIEVLHQHLELPHYVETYRQSTERVRWIIFVLMVLSVVVLLMQWNTYKMSWLHYRMSKLAEVADAAKQRPNEDDADFARRADLALAASTLKNRFQTSADLAATRDAYRSAVVDRLMLFEVPGIGVTLDINDLGLFSGVAFSLLLLLLVFALMREYENLYMALFKVRHLHDAKMPGVDALNQHIQHVGGDSTANFLYHALAMSQVFSAPPTLAVWRPSLLKRWAPSIVFLFPAVIQSFVIGTNFATLPVAEAYGVPWTAMIPQCVLEITVVALAIVAIIYANACNYRWRSAFLHINPSYKRVEAVPWAVWVRMWFRQSLFGDHLQRRLSGQLVHQLRVEQDRIDDTIEVEEQLEIIIKRTIKPDDDVAIAGDISYEELQKMSRGLRDKANAEAALKYPTGVIKLLHASVTSSVLDGEVWRAKAQFKLRKLGGRPPEVAPDHADLPPRKTPARVRQRR
jgi:hypothetical protein